MVVVKAGGVVLVESVAIVLVMAKISVVVVLSCARAAGSRAAKRRYQSLMLAVSSQQNDKARES
jgi:hypothetical protein